MEKNYRYTLHKNLHYDTRIYGLEYQDEFVSLLTNGSLHVKPGFKSDGCSPVYKVFGLIYITPPDGLYDQYEGMPVTGRAFYGHDAIIYALRRAEGSKKSQFKKAHELFCREIAKVDFWPKKLYCKMVEKLGPRH